MPCKRAWGGIIREKEVGLGFLFAIICFWRKIKSVSIIFYSSHHGARVGLERFREKMKLVFSIPFNKTTIDGIKFLLSIFLFLRVKSFLKSNILFFLWFVFATIYFDIFT